VASGDGVRLKPGRTSLTWGARFGDLDWSLVIEIEEGDEGHDEDLGSVIFGKYSRMRSASKRSRPPSMSSARALWQSINARM
jgi:hypothetical protein